MGIPREEPYFLVSSINQFGYALLVCNSFDPYGHALRSGLIPNPMTAPEVSMDRGYYSIQNVCGKKRG